MSPQAISDLLDDLVSEGLQSDLRFTQAYIRSRSGKGYGPRRILSELGARGIDEGLGATCLDDFEAREATNWVDVARATWRRKFGGGERASSEERFRQMRFLEYRGFTHAQIRIVMDSDPHD